MQKKAKFLSAGFLAKFLAKKSKTPVPPAAGGFAPRPPLASGGWGLRPQTSKTAPPLRIPGNAPDFWYCSVLQLQFTKLCINFVSLVVSLLVLSAAKISWKHDFTV